VIPKSSGFGIGGSWGVIGVIRRLWRNINFNAPFRLLAII